MSVADPHLMLAFEGTEVPSWLEQRLRESPPAGVTLFREWNMESPEQTAALTRRLQSLHAGPKPLMIAVDQEGGQLIGIAGSTPFAGNMALGATDDPNLVSSVANRMGTEMADVGINVNYAPVADVATRADNPSLGVRSFGDDPDRVATLTRAAVRGLHRAGVLSVVKHFPGQGDIGVDPHYELPVLDFARDRLDRVELAPFRAAVKAKVGMIMVGHYLVPELTGSSETPIFASERGIEGFIRGEMGYRGPVITDALDMGALDQGPLQAIEVVAMLRAGVDLLMCMPDPDLQHRVRSAIERAYARDLIPDEKLAAARRRIETARRRIVTTRARPRRLQNPEHQGLAKELAEKSVTVVRNEDGVLPLDLQAVDRILCLEPVPTNVTPADTTALYAPGLANAVRAHHDQVTEVVYPHRPTPTDTSAIVAQAKKHNLTVIATVTAPPEQAALVQALLKTDRPVITVALRTPWDLAAYPTARTHLCTYSPHPPSLEVLARFLFQGTGDHGQLPVEIPGLYPRGHGLEI